MYNNIDVMFDKVIDWNDYKKKVVQIKLGSAQYYILLNLYFYPL